MRELVRAAPHPAHKEEVEAAAHRRPQRKRLSTRWWGQLRLRQAAERTELREAGRSRQRDHQGATAAAGEGKGVLGSSGQVGWVSVLGSPTVPFPIPGT